MRRNAVTDGSVTARKLKRRRLPLEVGAEPPQLQESALATFAGLQGFAYGRFVAWHDALEECGAKRELQERREKALGAFRGYAKGTGSEDAILRHLEWMLLRWKWITGDEALAPLAAIGQKATQQRKSNLRTRNRLRKENADHEANKWRQMIAKDPALRALHAENKSSCARAIRLKLGLPESAVQRIRKAI